MILFCGEIFLYNILPLSYSNFDLAYEERQQQWWRLCERRMSVTIQRTISCGWSCIESVTRDYMEENVPFWIWHRDRIKPTQRYVDIQNVCCKTKSQSLSVINMTYPEKIPARTAKNVYPKVWVWLLRDWLYILYICL